MPFKTILNNIGGAIKTVTEFVEDEVIDPISNQLKYGADEFRQGNPAPVLNAMSLGMSGAMAPLTQAVRGVDETEGTLLESAGNYVEDKTGIPSLVTQVAAGVLIPGPGEYKAAGKSIARGVKKAFPLEGVDNIFPPTPPAALATAGAAPRVQLNVEKGGAVMKLTVEDPAILSQIPHVKKGVASTTEYAAGVQKLKKTKTYYELKRRIDQDKFEQGKITKDALKRANTKTQKMENAKLSTLATEMDPDIFEKANYKNLDVTSDFKFLDQHHGSGSKAMTAPWVQTALKIGNDDDVVALFELHKALMGSGMGNVKSAIIDAPTVVHNVATASKAGRNVDEAIHSFMKKNKAGIEISSEKVYDIIGQPKNMDELLQKYITFVDEYLLPQKNLSLKAVRKEFARYRSTLPVSKHAQFDEYLSKLNMANTDIFEDMS